MNVEREAKFKLVRDPHFYRYYLLRNGFRLVNKVVDRDTYFQHPCRDFGSGDEALRVRTRRYFGEERSVAFLCYKGPRRIDGLIKEREEREVRIDDYESLRFILLKLGFQEVISVVKYREIYVNDHAQVYIDHLVGVGWFMEIETSNSSYVEMIYEQLKDHLVVVKETYLEICLSTARCLDEVDLLGDLGGRSGSSR